MRTVFIIAVGGLAASMTAHLSTFFGINPQRIFPSIWLLHILVFVVWFPTVFSCSRVCTKEKRKDFWKVAMGNAPRWMKILVSVLFAYAFFNFFFTVFVLNKSGVPSELDGRKVLQSHGNIIRELTDEEYERHQAYSVRTFSGHWMVFYAIGMTALYSRIKEGSNNNVQSAANSCA